MPYISKDTPYYFLTSVTNSRLPIFRTDEFKQILADSFAEARASGNFSIAAYAIMPDHAHIVTGGELSPSNTLRYVNGISARRIVDKLKSVESFAFSLAKLRIMSRGEHKYSVWQHHANTFIITSEGMMMQKVNYVHNNPVEAGLCGSAEEYKYSSARFWLRRPLLDDEPLLVDLKDMKWRT